MIPIALFHQKFAINLEPKSLFSQGCSKNLVPHGSFYHGSMAARTAAAQRIRLSASTLTAVRSRLCQRTSDSDLIEERLQGAARRRLMRSHEQEARKPHRDDLPDLRADDLNYDLRRAEPLHYFYPVCRGSEHLIRCSDPLHTG